MTKTLNTSGPDLEEQTSPVESATGQISAYYLEIERLLDRVENSVTHYQTLGVERSATREEIQRVFRRAVTMLYPSQYGIKVVLTDEIEERTRKAFDKLSSAFKVLANFGKRTEYDNSLRKKTLASLPVNIPVSLQAPPATPDADSKMHVADVKSADNKPAALPEAIQDAVTIKRISMHREVYTKAIENPLVCDRRRSIRLKLSIPARVTGYSRDSGKWSETAQTVDVSRFGVALRLRRPVRHGAVLYLTLPLPFKLRSHGFSEPTYNVYAIVRRVEPASGGIRVAGLEFLGEHPPAGYIDKPWAIFRTRKWSGIERRREPRKEQAEHVAVEFLDESMRSLGEETGITENISRSGVQVRLKATPPEFDFVKVINRRRNFESLAVLRNRYASTDGFKHLCLRLIDHEWPG